MGNMAVVIPCSVLGAICACMLVFICWWFPRAWARGTAADIEEFERRRQQERDLELSAGGDESITGDGPKTATVPRERVYVPSPVTMY
jgi:hypothetical protein